MRFNRLTLLRYGPFDGRRLDFRPGARLHLVYGPNEAGKSVALAALGDLLFGFPHAVTLDFRHPAAEQRIAAEIEGADGTRLAFRRRRGRRDTLRADDDGEAPLPEAALAPFLGGLTREVFARAFGLNSAGLKAGAEAMLAPEGGEGAALFAAASGLTGLAAARRALEAEADGLWRPRGQRQPLNAALARRDDAARAEREALLHAAAWKRLTDAVTEARAAHEALRARRLAAGQERARLERLELLRPLLAEADRSAAALAGYADLAALPEGAGARLRAALDRAAAAQAAAARSAAEAATAAAAAAAVSVDAALLARGEAVTALHGRMGQFAKDAVDLPRVAAEEVGCAAELAQLARRLGLEGAEALAAAQPTDAALNELEALAERGERLAAEAETAARDLAAAEARLAEGRALAAPPDPTPWRLAFEALAPDLERIAQAARLAAERQRQAEALARRLADLDPPWPAGLAPAAGRLPAEAERREAAAAAEAAARTLAAAEAEHARLAAEARAAEAELAGLHAAGGPLPSRAAIAAARAARDAALDRLLRDPAAGPGAEAALRALVAEADRLADAAFAEAGRVARAELAEARRAAALAEGAAAAEALAAARAGAEAAAAAWAARFAPLGIVPRPPAAMGAWLASVAAARDEAAALAATEAELAAVAALEARVRPALDEIAAGIGGLEGLSAQPTPAAARAIAARLRALGEAWTAWQKAAGGLAEAANARARAAAARDRVQADLAGWRQRFDAALRAAGLAPGAGTAAARAARAAWAEVPSRLRERASLAARVRGLRRDMAAYAAEAEALAAALAPDLVGLPPEAVARGLESRLAAAREGEARRQALVGEAQRLGRAAAALAAEAAAAAAALEALRADLPATDDPDRLAARLAERDALAAAERSAAAALAAASGGEPAQALREALAALDPVAARLRLEELGREEAALASEGEAAFAALREAEARRDARAAAAGAEAAAFARAQAEAEARGLARDWAVARLAAGLLARAVDLHRERQGAPMLARAGALFARLTCGAFAGLVQDSDDDGRPVLYAQRAGGARVGRDGLSDGTADQLYLALRLAYLEDHAARQGPVPFVGDDLFQTFDDARAAAGLAALAEAGARFQVILFTHEASIAGLAREAVGEGLDLIEL